MMTIYTLLLRYRTPLLRVANALLILVLVGCIVHLARKPARVIQLDPITKVVEVPVEKLTTKTVTQYVKVEDKAAVNDLLKANDALKAHVDQLTVALAEAQSTSSGPASTTIPIPTPTIVKVPVDVSFTDWRLKFQSNGNTATYTLSQKFAIVNTVGRNDQNVPVNLIRLYEIGANGERVAIPTTENTTIAIAPPPPHFYVKPTIQAGLGVIVQPAPTTTTRATEFIASVPWLKHGSQRVSETTRYAYLTPALSVTKQEFVIGVLPASLNLGTLPRSPFTDLWVSPFVGVVPKTSAKRWGFVFTTTF